MLHNSPEDQSPALGTSITLKIDIVSVGYVVWSFHVSVPHSVLNMFVIHFNSISLPVRFYAYLCFVVVVTVIIQTQFVDPCG